MLPFLQRDVNIQVTATGGAATTGRVTLTVSGHAWRPTAPVDERIEALRQYITVVETRLNDVARHLHDETANRAKASPSLSKC